MSRLPPPSAPAIVAKNLVHSARGHFWRPIRPILGDVSFQLDQGEVLGFLGHNGAGKTTTLRILLGLLRPRLGTATLFGVPSELPQSRAGLGFLPERAYYPATATAHEFVAAHARLAGIESAQAGQEIERVLRRVGLSQAAHRRLATFSKGMLQRAGLAQALLGRPRLLLLDEPLDGLDPLGRQQVRTLLQEERDRGCSILFCTHVLSDAQALCDRVVVLRRGRVHLDAATEELLRQHGGAPVPVELCTGPLTPEVLQALQSQATQHRPQRDGWSFWARNVAEANGWVDLVRQGGGSVLALQPQQRDLEELLAAGEAP